ncbi:MAG: hypothetical protein ACREDR_04505 [Blastocatellia bacterium]
MKDLTLDEIELRRYLLGDMTEDEKLDVERRLFTDRSYSDQFPVVEDALILDYLDKSLSSAEFAMFERHFMRAPARREHVVFTAALKRCADSEAFLQDSEPFRELQDEHPPGHPGWASLVSKAAVAAVAAMLLMAVACGWLLLETRRLKGEIAQLRADATQAGRIAQLEQQLLDERQLNQKLSEQAEDERARSLRLKNQLDATTQSQSPRLAGRSVVSVALVAGVPRANQGGVSVRVPRAVRTLRLVLELEDEAHRVYTAELRTAEGKLAWRSGHLAPQRTRSGRALIALVPASSLERRGDFLMSVNAISADGQEQKIASYAFTLRPQ